MADLSDEDKKLFRDAVKHVTKLTPKSSNPLKKKPTHSKQARQKAATEFSAQPQQAKTYLRQKYSADDEFCYVKSGLQNKRLRLLKQGKIPFEAQIDLHKATTAQAEVQLQSFIAECMQHGVRCGLVIHGKGYSSDSVKPVLKNWVIEYLRDRREIIAICSADRRHGGAGACYVLFKHPGKV